jgi:2-keto-4-pentenoate hydratase/2-oxohepta-3-ene-1,7-dioic acid hydratase in catechol pathway
VKLVTFELDTPLGAIRRAGALTGDGAAVVDLAAAHRATAGDGVVPADLLELLRGGEPALEAASAALERVVAEGADEAGGVRLRHELAEVRLLTPLPRPSSIRNFSLVEQHMLASIEVLKKKVGGQEPSLTSLPPEWYKLPAYYKTTVEEVYGPDEVVPWPELTDFYDYELEIAAVIGKTGRRVAVADAGPYIFGYMLYNDWSARDFQQREMSINLGPGLCKDFASSLGPCIVTADEFDLRGARLQARVDGETWTDTTAGLRVGFEDLVAYLTQVQTIVPGDVLTSGTVAGGSGNEQERWLWEGAVVELEAEGIGVLRNTVGRKGEDAQLPASQRPWIEALAR